MNSIIVPLFPQTIEYCYDDAYINTIQEELVDWCLEYKKKHEKDSVIKSNRSGWQCDSNLFDDPSFHKYWDYIMQHSQLKSSLESMKWYAWLNVNPPGAFNIVHTHPKADFSGVFWVKVKNDDSGKLFFVNKNSQTDYNLIESCGKEFRDHYFLYHEFRPNLTNGSTVIFPSSMLHGVDQNKTDEDRISISFNLSFT